MTDETTDAAPARLVLVPKPSPRERALLEASHAIREAPPAEFDFLHSDFCHVALPRSKPKERTFMRRFQNHSIHLQAGVIIRNGEAIEQALPYGIRPRQFLIYATTYALRKNTREIDLGHSMRDLMLTKLGFGQATGGRNGSQTSLRQQLYNLVACRMTLGYTDGKRDVTLKYDIFSRLDDPSQWYTDEQRTLWPATATLSAEYLEQIKEHALPIDPRAIAVLDSALAIDIYSWLAMRLHKLPRGMMLHWASIRQQFGQDYDDAKNFKKEFTKALRQAVMVYPSANISSVDGGLYLRPSASPVPKIRVVGGLDQPAITAET